jgi:hypothetical protein
LAALDEIGDFVRHIEAELFEAGHKARLARSGRYILRVRDELGGAAQQRLHSVDLTCVQGH